MEKKINILKELEHSLAVFKRRHTRLVSLSRRFSFIRLWIFVAGVVLILISFFFFNDALTLIFIILSVISFGITAGYHNKINRGIKKNHYWIKIKEAQSARIKIEWDNIPEYQIIIPDMKHPFDADLSITGKFSIHRLIDNTVSLEGSTLLKDWLTSEEPDQEQIKFRQELVKELKSLNRFRNKLLLHSRLASPERLESGRFTAWLKSGNSIEKLKKLITLAASVLIINVILFLLFLFAGLGPLFTIGLLVYSAIYFFNINLIRDSFNNALHVEGELGKFDSILNFLETYPYNKKSKLEQFCLPLVNPGKGPKPHFKKIRNLINALSFQKNPLTALVLNILFPWDFHFTLKLQQEKEELSKDLDEWLSTWHNLEALCSLAEFAYLNPEYTFPLIITETSEIVFDVKGIAHPLIPYYENVSNDFEIKTAGEVSIITGSNMSGKSTFLKTLGTNLVLAYAGAPVNAIYFRTSLLRIFTCIKIDDSVTDGISYFYAEVKRLKELLNRLNEKSAYPLFFLVDEIFRGTNNLERLIGSRSYIKALGGRNGAGLISTHDLDLVKLENELHHIHNFHFREEAVDGKMIFDYKLRKGPSPTTNALKIMKLEGLPVD